MWQFYTVPHKVYLPGDVAPNLTLLPPTPQQPVVNADGRVNPRVRVLTTGVAAPLSDLLRSDMGAVCWAACQQVGVQEGPMFGEEGVWNSKGEYFLRPM